MEEKMIINLQNHLPVSLSNFGGLDEEYANLRKAKAVILEVPYERTTTYKKGAKNGPAAIIDASRYLELFDDELNQETYRIGIHTMSSPGIETLEPQDMVEKVYSMTQELLRSGKFPVILGGEHSVTFGAVRAFKEAYQNISVLQFDAHYDLKDEYHGSKWNHGCVARRISEICPLVQIGVRSLAKEERDFLATQTNGRVKAVSVYDILDTPLWKDVVCNSLSENVYVTIDMDVFDPSVVPAVGTPEPGGIGWYETLDLLREVAKDKRIVGFDVMELCPIRDQIASDFLAAKLVYRLLGYAFPARK
jgi:agmatinase